MNSIGASVIEKIHFDEKGLVPAIAQDWLDGAVLMMAWMNREALEKTIKNGNAYYWSRSRNEIWRKGETSGNTQEIKAIRYDCDSDVILLTIKQKNSISCHKGVRSCFFNEINNEGNKSERNERPPSNACNELFNTIEDRFSKDVEGSYTKSLINGGDNQILKKIGEESAEFIMACKDESQNSIANEAADIIFHLQVALKFHNVSWDQVLEILASRRGKRRFTKS